MTVGLKARQNKYKAKPVSEDGYRFLSQLEHRHYLELKLRSRAGDIQDLEVHPRYPIIWPASGAKICVVELDFRYLDSRGTLHIVDTKGHTTALGSLKKKLVEAAYGIVVEIVKR